MKKIVIFLGPSLPVKEAKNILDAVYLPPAKQSDLISAIETYKPDVIGLIDGVFLNHPSVWHKEILYAIEQGVAVYGASSMGALRAAETDALGMVGVGKIYRMYASKELVDDDEVALVHGSEDSSYRPLSEPMVNIRATFYRAQEEEIISNDLCQQLTAIAKSTYFPERTFTAIFRKAANLGIASSNELELLADFVKVNYVDLKQKDAVLLLQLLKDLPEEATQLKPDFELRKNQFFSTLYYRDRTIQRHNTKVALGDIAAYAALHLPDFNAINLQAANRALVQILADMLGVNLSQVEVDKETRHFRSQYSLIEETEFANWLTENDLRREEFEQLMYEMARCRYLQNWLLIRKSHEKNSKILLDELRLHDRYQECAEATAQREKIIQEHYANLLEEYYDSLTMSQLVIEHRKSTESQVSLRDDWLKEAGFLSPELLKLELLRSHLVRKVMHNEDTDSVG
ncbi:MAG: TfuA-related McrA-glycine thioamidation protein [Coleofasciculaceae cyanobacterium]